MFWKKEKLPDGSFRVASQCLEFELEDELKADLLLAVMNLVDPPFSKVPFIIRSRTRTTPLPLDPRFEGVPIRSSVDPDKWPLERIRFVSLFQQTFGLQADGKPGELTFRKLRDVTEWAKQLGKGWVSQPSEKPWAHYDCLQCNAPKGQPCFDTCTNLSRMVGKMGIPRNT